MSFDYFSKRRMQYILEKLKNIFDTKVDKVSGKGLSTNDYTNEDKAKVTSSDSKITNYEDRGYLGKNGCNTDTFVQGLLNFSTGVLDSAASSWITSDFIPISGTATLSGYKDGTEANFCVRLCEYDVNKTFIKNTSNLNVTENATWSRTITLDSNTRYVRTSVGFNNKATTPSAYFATNRLQIELGSTATSYEAYVKSNVELDAEIVTKINKSGDTMSGALSLSYPASATMTYNSTNPQIGFSETGGNQGVKILYTDYDTYRSPYGLKVIGDGSSAAGAWFEVEGNLYSNGGKQSPYLSATPTSGQVIVADGTGGAVKTSGYTIAKSVPSDAKFTDTTYSSKAAASGGTDVSLVTTGEKATWNNKSNLALGTSSSTAFRGDYGNSAYAHAVTNKGSAFANGLYKITTNSEGHVTAATAVAKADITALGIPGSDTNNRKSFYGTCDTAAATAAKVVTISDTNGWELRAGTIIGIKFTNDNTANNVTLNVNNSGAKSIFYNNAVYTTATNYICGAAGKIIYYMYDGTNWAWLNFNWHSDGNDKVTQTATTTNADYEVLFSVTADNTTRTETARKNSNLKFNPSTGNLQPTMVTLNSHGRMQYNATTASIDFSFV